MLGKINKELTRLGYDEIKIINDNLLEVYHMTSQEVSNQIGFQQTIELPAERVVHSIWCKDGKD